MLRLRNQVFVFFDRCILDACLNDLASKWFEFIMIEVIEVLKEERSQNICTLVVRISANFRLL